MTAMLWTIASIWGLSCAITLVIFALDERAHRRQRTEPTEPPAKTFASAPYSEPVTA